MTKREHQDDAVLSAAIKILYKRYGKPGKALREELAREDARGVGEA